MEWKQGVKGLTHNEREAYLACERHAPRLAVELECAERCVASPLGLADCSDIKPGRIDLEWVRKQGRLYVRANVYVRSSGSCHTFRWRIHLPYSAARVTVNRKVRGEK